MMSTACDKKKISIGLVGEPLPILLFARIVA
jgi:hypothetical protein